MTVENATFISQLDATYPAAGDLKSEGDNHLRLIKTAVKGSFPNLTAVAVTATSVELNYVTGVTSSIQAQINAEATARIAADALKADLASPALTGTPTAPTPATSTNSPQLATTAFVQAVLSTAPAGNLPTIPTKALQVLRVNAAETGVEWGEISVPPFLLMQQGII